MPEWLKNAVFYEIYPQSFCDSNADGIGDIKGMESKLDYIRDLGCNALWINPVYDSPFKDAGYDVRDYKKIAARYGTNEDMYHFFEEAHKRGIRVLMDLVPGHTSEEHAWFTESKKPDRNEYSDRYVWTNSAWQGVPDHPYVSGEADRDGVYMLNFFKCQPALNYGWGKVSYDWQSAADAPECIATREAMKDVMRFWLDHGCDGFRVDMADSLVKDDDEVKSNTQAIWKNVRQMMDEEYPNAAMVSEWSNPKSAIPGGFHMDFYLDHHHNGYNTLLRDYEPNGMDNDNSYFRADGDGDINRFLDDYLPKYNATKDAGYISMFTCNHDTPRPARTLTPRELMLAYGFIFTMPGVPFLYYGDEIGMHYQTLVSKEGGFQRTGSRTPMQWDNSVNAGFSEADPKELYLPIDPDADFPNVQNQKEDPSSLYSMVKNIIALRHANPDLWADTSFEVINAVKGTPFVYARGALTIVINPSKKTGMIDQRILEGKKEIFTVGKADAATGEIEPQTFAVFA